MKVDLIIFGLLVLCVQVIYGVPHVQTEEISDRLLVEFSTVRNTIKVLSDQWEKWNTLFVTSLEPRISSTASILASIDSNIHNLQERAHVWDTFQLHVTAWNEQLASLDRKMDILSKGQETILSLDGKINNLLALEYKLDNMAKNLEKVQDTTNSLDTLLQSKSFRISHDTLLSEFTSRGVLSSIKSVERKLDRLLIANQNTVHKTSTASTNSNDKQKLHVKCNTPKVVEDLLNDIASKVDVMFDTITKDNSSSDDSIEHVEEDGEFIEFEGSGENINYDTQANSKGKKKPTKKSTQTCKQMNPTLEEILNRTIRIENATLIILDKEDVYNEKEKKSNSKLLKVMENSTADLYSTLSNYFSEQRVHFESAIQRYDRMSCDSNTAPSTEISSTALPVIPTTEHVPTVTKPTTLSENLQPTWRPMLGKSSCEDLDGDENSSGVYIFEKQNPGRESEKYFNKRYCEIRSDGIWTVIQRRDNYMPIHNFNVSWKEYKNGFGNMHTDFWMGNDFLHMFSNENNLVLKIELEDFEKNFAMAEYSNFVVGSESENYKLSIGKYRGNATDSFSGHNGSYFSTYDRKNDKAPECCPCAVTYGGGWWFHRCFESNLNGQYFRDPDESNYFRGIIWEQWLGNYSLKKSVMMVRSRGRVYSPTRNVQDEDLTRITYEDP
ncbi:unnamed protein product [Phaedon cochleariae]|uniref:Fibrinogen C-terminal domain-containing protein n=1 Tax=Phaedon cochleariae TaxID=80249 RepID=A0A9P0DS26_PHACE|nr:unnamed protein product [Phaedon cochleariae]